MTATPQLVEHFFRREYGRLVAILCGRVGVRHIDLVEDAVQAALMKALESWTSGGQPDNPTAWLLQVARNQLIGGLRQNAAHQRILDHNAQDIAGTAQLGPACYLPGEINDDLLQMLFVCCDEAIARESQIVLALKTLCGFSVREISLRLFATEAKIYKRLARARERLRASTLDPSDMFIEQFADRLGAVHNILYLLFTEGYLSSHAHMSIRCELCDEALRLTDLLARHTLGQTPQTYALLALMHLHRARMSTRCDGTGGLLLLEEQDRAQWDQSRIAVGLAWLEKSALGDEFSRYHAEAGIAAEHCLAPSFEQTRWQNVAQCYALLERDTVSPVHRLNRAVAVAMWQGPTAGLALLESFDAPDWLTRSYMWLAVMADLHRRCGQRDEATRFGDAAIAAAPTDAVRALIRRRLTAD